MIWRSRCKTFFKGDRQILNKSLFLRLHFTHEKHFTEKENEWRSSWRRTLSLEQIGRSKIGWFGGLRYKNIITLSSTLAFWLLDKASTETPDGRRKKSGDGRVFYSGSSSDVVGGLSLPFAVTNICLVLCPSPLARSTHRQRTRIRSWTLWIPKTLCLAQRTFFSSSWFWWICWRQACHAMPVQEWLSGRAQTGLHHLCNFMSWQPFVRKRRELLAW